MVDSNNTPWGLLPSRNYQPRTLTVCDGPDTELEAGHWYSPAAVQDLLERERERCAVLVWNHFMETCQATQRRPGDAENAVWCAADTIRIYPKLPLT